MGRFGHRQALLVHGYAAWAPWQLESEVLRSAWKVCNASFEDVFTLNQKRLDDAGHEGLWDRLWQIHGAAWEAEELGATEEWVKVDAAAKQLAAEESIKRQGNTEKRGKYLRTLQNKTSSGWKRR